MTIITISRQAGSYGDEIAKKVADKLNYTLIDKTKLYEMASGFLGEYEKEVGVLLNESKPGFFDFLFHQRSVYGHLISAMIYDSASSDNVVIVGRGGQFLLKNDPHVINARIVAPFEMRVERCRQEQALSEEIAFHMVKKTDLGREEFIRFLFREEVAESNWYDVVVNTDKIGINSVIGFFVSEAKRLEKELPVSEQGKELYKNRSLEKRVEIVLMKKMEDSNYIHASAESGGKIVISGYLSTEAEYIAAEKHVRAVPGVSQVENKIIVSQFPVRPWY